MTHESTKVEVYTCNVCSDRTTTESDYGERPKGWATIDAPGCDWDLCPTCWEKLLAFPAFPAPVRVTSKLRGLK